MSVVEVETLRGPLWMVVRCLLRRRGRFARIVDPGQWPTSLPNESMERRRNRDVPQVFDVAFTECEIAITPFRNAEHCLDPGV